MLECDQALELISAHIDGVLTPEEERALAGHLEHCPACRSLMADLEQMHREMQALSDQPAPHPAGLRDDIMARIRADASPRADTNAPPRAGIRGRWRAWAAMAAVFAVVLLGASTLRIWQTGGSGAMMADAAANGSAAAPTSTQADTSTGGKDLDESGSAPADEAGDPKEASLQAGSSSGSDAGEPARGGGAADESSSALSSSPPGTQAEDLPAGQGDSPAQTAQPRTDSPDANSLPQPYGVAPLPSPGADSAVTTALSPVYVGVLTLTWDQAAGLEALDGLSYTTQGDQRAYVLPASDFEALVHALGASGTLALRQEGADISPDATQGLVLVTGVPQAG